MAEELDLYRIGKEGDDKSYPLAREAREALAQLETERLELTDEELLHEWDLVPGARAYEEDVVDFARAVLARFGGRPASAPAAGRGGGQHD